MAGIDHGKKFSTIVSTETPGSDCDALPKSNQKRPIALLLSSLICFNLCVIGFCISIALSWALSRSSGGFVVNNINQYILKYSPTAILIWIVAVWRQVDYHTKVATPRWELSKGECQVSKSLLADYVSTLQAAAFWTAMKNRHFPVVLTTMGFVLLKVATLSSTGLLVLDPAVILSQSNGSMESSIVSKTFGVDNDTSTSDQSLLYTTYGVLVQDLQKPFGLGQGLAYQTFTPPAGNFPTSDFTTAVDAFVPVFQCQPMEIAAQLGPSNTTEPYPDITYQMLSPDCSLLAKSPSFYTLNPSIYRCPARQLSGLVQNINCGRSMFGTSSGVYKLYLLADMRYSQELNESQANFEVSERVEASAWSTEINQMTGLVCRLSYSMQSVTVEAQMQHFSAPSVAFHQTPTDGSRLPGFDDDDLDSLFRGALSASDDIFGSRTDDGYALEYPDPNFKLMAAIAGGTYESLLDASIMSSAASKVSSQLAAQIAHQYLREPRVESLEFTVHKPTFRLRITTLSAVVVVASLATLVILNAGLAASYKRRPSEYFADNLESSVRYLKANDSLVRDLIASQAYTEKQLAQHFRDTNVRLSHNSEGQARISLSEPSFITPEPATKQPWWHPITVSPAVLVFTFTMTLAAIVVLEILQHASDAKFGFADLPDTSNYDNLFTNILPALLVLTLASLFNCLDFNVLLLTPFHTMKTPTSLKTISTRSLLSEAPPISLTKSLRHRMWAAVFSSSAALVGSLMTIVVSGLYDAEMVPHNRTISISTTDSFRPAWENSALNDSGAALLSSLTENLNFPYPAGTFSEIAFPAFRPKDNVSTISNASLSLTMPVWRASLDCVTLSSSNVSILPSQSPIQNTVTINATYGLPKSCLLGGFNGNESTLGFVQTFTFPSSENSTYFGKLLDLHVGPFDPITGESQGERLPRDIKDNPLGCPSLAFIYGFISLQDSKSENTMINLPSVDVCYQKLQRVQSLIEFSGADLTVNSSVLPRVNESSVEYISWADDDAAEIFYASNASSATSYQFRIQHHFDQRFVVFNNTHDNPYSSLDAAARLAVDPFFQGVLFGQTPIPLSTLQVNTEESRSQLRSGILASYRRYMAQAISLNMRVVPGASQATGTDSEAERDIPAVQNPGYFTRRIMQQRSSKTVLQSMLGFMLLCGIASVSTIQMRKLLPAAANPCTIWGQMSLFAGSRFDEIDRVSGRQRPEYANLQSEGGAETMSCVKIGWWDTNDDGKRYGIELITSNTNT